MKHITIFACVLAIISCSGITTSYDYDKTADFKKFKTYNYTEDALKLPIQELNRNRMLQAIDREMTARGFTKSDNPDLLVDLIVKAEQKQEATATTTGTGMYGRGYGYGGGFTTTQIDVNEFIEGTLFVNLVDRQADKLVWSGRGTKVIDETATPERREKNINEAITAIFKNYPAAK